MSASNAVATFTAVFPILIGDCAPIPVIPPVPFTSAVFVAGEPSTLYTQIFVLCASVIAAITCSAIGSLPHITASISLFSLRTCVISSFTLLLSPNASILFTTSNPLFVIASSNPVILSFTEFTPGLSTITILPPSGFWTRRSCPHTYPAFSLSDPTNADTRLVSFTSVSRLITGISASFKASSAGVIFSQSTGQRNTACTPSLINSRICSFCKSASDAGSRTIRRSP